MIQRLKIHKRIGILFIVILLASLLFFPQSSFKTKADPPPFGDWNITTEESYNDRIFIVNGNIIISDTGKLNLDNVTIFINSTSNGQYKIDIKSGGELSANNSIITAFNPSFRFKFEVYGNLTAKYSRISELWGNNSEYPFIGGIQVYNGNLSLNYTTVKNSESDGIYVNTGNVEIRNSNITDNWCYEFYADNAPSLDIINSNFTDYIGVLPGGGLVIKNSPYSNLTNNNIKGHTLKGLELTLSPHSNISHNNFEDLIAGGMYFDSNHNSTIFHNNLTHMDGTALLLTSSPSTVIENNTIADISAGVGLQIGSSDVSILNNRISSLLIGTSGASIVNNTIGGLDIINLSDVTLVNNTIGGLDIINLSDVTLVNNTIGGLDIINLSDVTLVNSAIGGGGIDMSGSSNATIINSIISGGTIEMHDSFARFDATTLYGVYLHTNNSTVLMINSTIDSGNPFGLSWGSHVTILNVSVEKWDLFYVDAVGFNEFEPSELIVQNYLSINTRNASLNPLSDVDVEVKDNGNLVYSSPGFGGPEPQTNVNGEVNWITVTDRIYHKDEQFPGHIFTNITYNITSVEVSRSGYQFSDNPRNADMYTSHIEVFIEKDLIPPIIAQVESNPNPQALGGNVNVSANIIDNGLIDKININITSPTGETLGNFTMYYDSKCGKYFYNNSYSVPGIYNFIIWASDLSNNSNYTSSFFDIIDPIKPTLQNLVVTPQVQELNSYVNISNDIIDNYDLFKTVKINITTPSGSWNNMTMLNSGDNYFLNLTYSEIGAYSFIIWANDSSNNWNCTIGGFQVIDITKPTIEHIPKAAENLGMPIQIKAHVEDDYMINEVWLNFSDVNGFYYNQTMNLFGGLYVCDIPAQTNIGTILYFIWVDDKSSNANQTGQYQLEVKDVTAPSIQHDASTPASINTEIKVEAIVSDDVLVGRVTLYFRGMDVRDFYQIEMMKTSNNTYEAVIPAQNREGTLIYYIVANDSSNNVATSSRFYIDLEDTNDATNLAVFLILLLDTVAFILIILYFKQRKKHPK